MSALLCSPQVVEWVVILDLLLFLSSLAIMSCHVYSRSIPSVAALAGQAKAHKVNSTGLLKRHPLLVGYGWGERVREGGSRDKTLIKIISPKHTTKPSSSMQSVALGLPPDHLALILHTSSSSRLVFRSPLLLLVNKSSPSPPPHLSFFCSIQFDHKRTLVRSFSCCFLASSSCTLTNSSFYVAGCTTCIHLLFLRVFSLPLCLCAFQFNGRQTSLRYKWSRERVQPSCLADSLDQIV